MVRLSTPVRRRPKCPPLRIEKSRSNTLRQFFRAMALLPTPACSATRWRASRPLRPGPVEEAFAPDQAGSGDAEVVDVLAPEQGVVPVVVAVILVSVPCGLGLGGVVDSAVIAGLFAGERGVGGDDCAALQQKQMNVALEMNGETEVASGGEDGDSATGRGGRFDRVIDGFGVEGLAVAGRAVFANVEVACRRSRRILRGCGCERESRDRGCGQSGAGHAKKVAAKRVEVAHRWSC